MKRHLIAIGRPKDSGKHKQYFLIQELDCSEITDDEQKTISFC